VRRQALNLIQLVSHGVFLNLQSKLTTGEGDLVLDPFAGSNVTGEVAERLNRNWVAFEREEKYLEGSKFRFWPSDLQKREDSIQNKKQKMLPLGISG
jgi:DNA modification methylase